MEMNDAPRPKGHGIGRFTMDIAASRPQHPTFFAGLFGKRPNGIIFSIDAALALTIVALALSALLIVSGAGQNDGANQAALHIAATDKAVVAYIDNNGSLTDNVPSANNVYCKQFAKYSDSGSVDLGRVRKCAYWG